MLEEKLAFYFTLWVQTYWTPYIELANFVVTVPGRKGKGKKRKRERERETSGFNRSGTVCHLGYVILSDACVYFITSKQENTALSY